MLPVDWKIGDRVRAHWRHWLRPHAPGTIVAIDLERNSEYVYYIQFDHLGKGIKGRHLWLDAYNLEHFDESLSSKPQPTAKNSAKHG